MGLVHRVESFNAFVACAHRHDEDGPTAIVICDTCRHVEEFADPAIGRGLPRCYCQLLLGDAGRRTGKRGCRPPIAILIGGQRLANGPTVEGE